MTYPEAQYYLESFIDYERQNSYEYQKSFSIEKMKRLAGLLGNPQEGIRSIHIAGSKGKGSTAAFTQSILRSAGFRTGLYTSPHLVSFRERIRINDDLIGEEDICRLLERIKGAVEEMDGDRPSFFEVYTALAYLYFKEQKVDFAVYEVGMGGRLDATNIIQPLVSAITPISYEHTQKLGPTLRLIAMEKAGIIKDNGTCVSAPQEREALEAIEGVARQRNSRLMLVGRDILFKELSQDESKTLFSVFGAFEECPGLESSLLGTHQVINAATAIGIIEALRFHKITISAEAVRAGIKAARWEGRLEVIKENPRAVVDGAQNRASAAALAEAIKSIFKFRKLILVLGVSKDKDLKGILGELLPISDEVILTKSKIAERAMEPAEMENFVAEKRVVLTSSVKEALAAALAAAGEADLILITGSLFVVGEAKELWTTPSLRFQRR